MFTYKHLQILQSQITLNSFDTIIIIKCVYWWECGPAKTVRSAYFTQLTGRWVLLVCYIYIDLYQDVVIIFAIYGANNTDSKRLIFATQYSGNKNTFWSIVTKVRINYRIT